MNFYSSSNELPLPFYPFYFPLLLLDFAQTPKTYSLAIKHPKWSIYWIGTSRRLSPCSTTNLPSDFSFHHVLPNGFSTFTRFGHQGVLTITEFWKFLPFTIKQFISSPTTQIQFFEIPHHGMKIQHCWLVGAYSSKPDRTNLPWDEMFNDDEKGDVWSWSTQALVGILKSRFP